MNEYDVKMVGLARVVTVVTVKARSKREAEEKATRRAKKLADDLPWQYDGAVAGITAAGVEISLPEYRKKDKGDDHQGQRVEVREGRGSAPSLDPGDD